MKRINELKQERASTVKEMEAILNVATTQNRSKTEAEATDWSAKNERVLAIDAEVKQLERQDELNRSIAGGIDVEVAEVTRKYDFNKAIREARSGNLTGLEAEMHQEAQRELQGTSGVVGNLYLPSMMFRANEGTKTTGAAGGHIPTAVGGLNVVAPNPLYKELGATVYENLINGKLELPFSKGHTAGRVAEEGDANQSVPTKAKGTLTASRFQGWQTYTQEYLSESVVLPNILADMVAAIDRAVGKDLVSAASLTGVLTGFLHTDTAAFIDYAGILALMAAVENDNFTNEGLVLSKELFYHLAATPKLTTVSSLDTEGDVVTSMGNFIVDLASKNKGLIAGVDAFGTSYLPKAGTSPIIHEAVYGDWKEAYVGFWGGVQLLVDPYTASNSGHVKITFSRMADTAVNPYAFASKRNIKIV